MALDATIGGANADSYATVIEATAYNAARTFSSLWVSAADDVKDAAMRMACRLLDASFTWTGSPVDSTQALCWPRNGMLTRNGFDIPSTTIPKELKNAQAEFARQLIAADRSADNDVLKQNIKSLSAGPVSLSWRLPSDGANSLDMLNAMIRQMGPEFGWMSRVMPDAVPMLLVDSWYTRPLVSQDIVFETSR